MPGIPIRVAGPILLLLLAGLGSAQAGDRFGDWRTGDLIF